MDLNLIAEALHRADSELSAYAAHRPLDKREAQEVSDLCRRAVRELPSLRERMAAKEPAAPDAGVEQLRADLAAAVGLLEEASPYVNWGAGNDLRSRVLKLLAARKEAPK